MSLRQELILTVAFCIGFASIGHAKEGNPLSDLTEAQASDRANFVLALREARLGNPGAQVTVARTYLELGEYARALPMLRAAAVSGDAAAAYQLGVLYEEGRGVERDPGSALGWYRRASESGDAAALAALARLLPQEDPVAAEFRKRAADAGSPDAQYALGLEQGKVKGKDAESMAFRWFEKAARQGHVGAQIALALWYAEGRGVARDPAAAQRWLESAAQGQDPVASFLLAQVYRDATPAKPEKLKALLRIAAEKGHREAQYQYGTLLAESLSADRDGKSAQFWLERAWQGGHVAAANRLGELLNAKGADVQQLARARTLFLKAAEHGDANAMYNFAQMQHEGVGGEKDTFAALKWFSKAADGNHERASEVVEKLLGSSIKTSSLGLKGFWQ